MRYGSIGRHGNHFRAEDYYTATLGAWTVQVVKDERGSGPNREGGWRIKASRNGVEVPLWFGSMHAKYTSTVSTAKNLSEEALDNWLEVEISEAEAKLQRLRTAAEDATRLSI